MKGKSVALRLPDGSTRRITSVVWKELKRRKHAEVVAGENPFTVRMKELAMPLYRGLYRWSERSGGYLMNGALLMRRPPAGVLHRGDVARDTYPPEFWGKKRLEREVRGAR